MSLEQTDNSKARVLSEAERHTILVEWNQTAVDYPRDVPLHQLFESQVRRTPDAVAVVSGSQSLTYRQLNHRANQLANYLRKKGVGPDVLVGVCAERSLEMVIALLASIKAGGAYVPLDPEYPRERVESMLADANPAAVLTQAHLLNHLPQRDISVFCLDRDCQSIASESTDDLSVSLNGRNIAYAIYTSGSTGKPKGVPNTHEGIVNRLLWMQDMYKLGPADRVLQKTPYSFDVSVWEFFWPLITGARLFMARPGGHKDPAYLVDLIRREKITTLHFVPSMLSIFLEADGVERCHSIRQVFASGEALPYELQQRFFDRLAAELHNLYGPTEAAVDVTYWRCRPDTDKTIVPIGKPVANTQIYILDEHLEPVPIGVEGELHIGGIQLARGYLNRPELTAEKFIRNPFSRDPAARLYKTGDVARFLPDGNIEYVGRIDNQVKLRGFRIELGEIEAVLCECPAVQLAAVTVREDTPGDKRLVGYVVQSANQAFSPDSVKTHLKAKLPEYMIPSRFVVLPEMPLTTSGKIDRKALPNPPAQPEPTQIVAARSELEAKIIPIFRKTLGLKSVGVKDDFFELGGHSLLAARLLNQIRHATGKHIPLSAMLRASTVESLAALISSEDPVSSDSFVTQMNRGEKGNLPLFAVVIPGVETLGYAALGRHLGPQPLYTLQAHPSTPVTLPFLPAELDALAREYVAALRSVQPSGPYCFIAMCDDVVITQQMILQLEKAGHEVGFFAILDTWVLENSMVPWKHRISYYAQRLRDITSQPWLDQLRSVGQIIRGKVSPDVRVSESVESAPRRRWKDAYWPGPEFQQPKFHAPVVMFKRPRQPYFYIHDTQMGWGERALGGVELHNLPLDHENILREPHIKTIGKILVARLQRVEAACALPLSQ